MKQLTTYPKFDLREWQRQAHEANKQNPTHKPKGGFGGCSRAERQKKLDLKAAALAAQT